MASKLHPNSDGRPILVPANPPTRSPFWKIMSSIAVPRARVAMARLMPRARTAGRANRAPRGTVATTPAIMAGRNGQPPTSTSRPATRAPKPARANCASDSCPAYPVSTTSERSTIPMENVVTKASCQIGGTSQITIPQATRAPATTPGRRVPPPTAGRRWRKKSRRGRAWPR